MPNKYVFSKQSSLLTSFTIHLQPSNCPLFLSEDLLGHSNSSGKQLEIHMANNSFLLCILTANIGILQTEVILAMWQEKWFRHLCKYSKLTWPIGRHLILTHSSSSLQRKTDEMALKRCPKLKTCHIRSKTMPRLCFAFWVPCPGNTMIGLRVTISPSVRHLELQGAAR